MKTSNQCSGTGGVYIAAHLSEDSADSLLKFMEEYGIAVNVVPDQLHVTIIYSKAAYVDPSPVLEMAENMDELRARFDKLKLLGKDKECLVVGVESEALNELNAKCLELGMKSDYPEYQAHVTINTDVFWNDDILSTMNELLAAVRDDFPAISFESVDAEDIVDDWKAVATDDTSVEESTLNSQRALSESDVNANYNPNHTWEVYYDRPTRAWWAYRKDEEGNQVGHAGAGMTKDEAKADCLYQNGWSTSESGPSKDGYYHDFPEWVDELVTKYGSGVDYYPNDELIIAKLGDKKVGEWSDENQRGVIERSGARHLDVSRA